MARKKRQAEHVNHERWLVSYADFITLLFAFFVVMFAASNEDQQKAGQIAQSVRIAFQELAIFGSSGKVFPLFDEGGLPGESVSIIGNTHSAFSEMRVVVDREDKGDGDGDGEATIEEVKERLDTLLDQQMEEGEVRMMLDSRGLTISLAEAGFFQPGSSVIESAALSVVAGIGEKLRLLSNNIRVEDHTDNIPIHTALFPSNWELSTSRATNVLPLHAVGSQDSSPAPVCRWILRIPAGRLQRNPGRTWPEPASRHRHPQHRHGATGAEGRPRTARPRTAR